MNQTSWVADCLLEVAPVESLDGPVEIWHFYEELGDRPRSELSTSMQGLAAICDLRQEVSSGGFDVYFRYWGGDTAPVALEALSTTLGDEWATVLRDAMSLFGGAYPTRQEERESMLEELDIDDALDDLDRRFLKAEASLNADALLSALLDR
ncbi:MAG: DUF4375 domain-containing protein [Dermatophilaceae bacterium]